MSYLSISVIVVGTMSLNIRLFYFHILVESTAIERKTKTAPIKDAIYSVILVAVRHAIKTFQSHAFAAKKKNEFHVKLLIDHNTLVRTPVISC